MAFWKKNIEEHKVYHKTVRKLRRTKLRNTVPLLKVIQVVYAKVSQINLHQQASAIAFSFTLSLFPAILFLFSVIPFVAANFGMPDLSEQVLSLIEQWIPPEIYEFVAPTVKDILGNPRGSLVSFGFLFALYAATSGVVELMHTFNANYQHSEKRSFIKVRFIAVGLVFLFAFLLVFAVTIIPVAELAFHILQTYNLLNEDVLFLIFGALRYAVAFFVFYIGISFVYYIAPAVNNHWRFFSFGSTFAALTVIISTKAFAYYLSHFATYNKLYGSIGTLIALMLWLYILAWVLLIGFTLNASINEAKVAHQKELDQRRDLLDELDDDQ